MRKVLAAIAAVLIVVVGALGVNYFRNSGSTQSLSKPVDIGKTGYTTTGKDLLDKKSQKSYDKISDAIYKLKSPVKTKATTTKSVKQLMEYFKADNPQVFWLSNEFGYKYNFIKTDVASINLDYYYTDFESGKDVVFTSEMVEQMSREMELQTSMILDEMNPNATDYEKALFLHDYLITTVSYDETANFTHSSYGAIVDKRAVCDGLADAYSYLLNLCDIENTVAYGISDKNVFHAWNVIKLDDEYYHTDLTWDMPSEGSNVISYAHFNITDEQVLKNRTINSPFIGEDNTKSKYNQYLPIPHCTATKYNYFEYGAKIIKDYTDSSLEELLNLLENSVENKEDSLQVKFSKKEYLDEFITDVTAGTKRNFYRFPYSGKELETSIKTVENENIVIFEFRYLTH